MLPAVAAAYHAGSRSGGSGVGWGTALAIIGLVIIVGIAAFVIFVWNDHRRNASAKQRPDEKPKKTVSSDSPTGNPRPRKSKTAKARRTRTRQARRAQRRRN